MNSRGSDEFAHRQNADGTFDSICLSCYLTVSSAPNESALVDGEAKHSCTTVIAHTNGDVKVLPWRMTNTTVSQDESDFNTSGRSSHHDGSLLQSSLSEKTSLSS